MLRGTGKPVPYKQTGTHTVGEGLAPSRSRFARTKKLVILSAG